MPRRPRRGPSARGAAAVPLAICAALAGAAGSARAQTAAELTALRGQVAALEAELDALRQRVLEFERALETVGPGAPATAGSGVAMEEAGDPLTAAPPGRDSGIEFGGALRFTYFDDSFSDATGTKRGEAGLDLFRVNADGQLGGLQLSAEYRFYPYMETIRHGWVGYDFEHAGRIEGGVTQVPFGLLPYSSHNFWFDIPFYLGFSDDYDLGLKYVHEHGPWTAHAAFFKNDELNSGGALNRYGYDVVNVGGNGNEESNQWNLRLTRRFGREPGCVVDTGASAQHGELFNALTGGVGDRWAAALHGDVNCGRWNFQGQLMRYAFDPRNPAGADTSTMMVGAYEAAHPIAARGDAAIVNIAYNVPISWPAVDLLTCYNDYSRLDKAGAGFLDSALNVTGCVVNIGPTYTYVDLIRARNMVYFGSGSLAGDGSSATETRLNINFGYYF